MLSFLYLFLLLLIACVCGRYAVVLMVRLYVKVSTLRSGDGLVLTLYSVIIQLLRAAGDGPPVYADRLLNVKCQ